MIKVTKLKIKYIIYKKEKLNLLHAVSASKVPRLRNCIGTESNNRFNFKLGKMTMENQCLRKLFMVVNVYGIQMMQAIQIRTNVDRR